MTTHNSFEILPRECDTENGTDEDGKFLCCATCIHSKADPDVTIAYVECRRYPPTMIPMFGLTIPSQVGEAREAVFPLVRTGWKCGEYIE